MESQENKGKEQQRNEVFSQTIRAGKRTYFFDVKTTRNGELYLTITESKRRFNNETNKFYYEKHKVFLYREDFDRFTEGLSTVIHYINTGEKPEEPQEEPQEKIEKFSDVKFEDLGSKEKDES